MATIFEEITAFAREAAVMRGIDPDVVVKAIDTEGGRNEYARLGDFSGPPWYSGKSWWPLQSHYGGVDPPEYGAKRRDYSAWGRTVGQGNHFTYLTGWEPGEPRAWRDHLRYSLNRVKRGGWGPWYGPATVGIVGFVGVNKDHPWDANAERWDFEDGVPPPKPPPVPGVVSYDPSTPPERQVQNWSCSIRVATWICKSLGVNIDAGAMQDMMVPGFVTPELGLLQGSGEGLAAFLRTLLPSSVTITNHLNVSFDQVHAWAGSGPIGIGSHSLYHWVAVRDKDGPDALSGMNPSPDYQAVGDQFSRAEFDAWRPWNVVRVALTGAVVQPPPGEIAALHAEITRLNKELAEANTKLGVASVDYANALAAQIKELQAIEQAYRSLNPAA